MAIPMAGPPSKDGGHHSLDVNSDLESGDLRNEKINGLTSAAYQDILEEQEDIILLYKKTETW